MPERWTPESWRSKPIVQVPRISGRGEARRGREPARVVSAARLCRRGAQPEEVARAGRGRRCFPAAGRRLRRKLRGPQRELDPRLLPRVPADVGGAHLRGRLAGGEGRAHRRPVRQAALVQRREAQRRRAAELSRRHRQRRGIHASRAHARSAAPDRGLSPVRRDLEPAARLRAWRLREPRPRAPVDARFCKRPARDGPLQAGGGPHLRDARLHAGVRARSRKPSRAARHRRLHQPRSAAARLRAGDDAAGFDHRRLVLHVPATWCGSATARASSTTRMWNISAASRIRSA